MKIKILIVLFSTAFLLSCLNKSNKPEETTTLTPDQKEEINYIAKGLKYVMNTQSLLGKNLMTAIQEKGTVNAIAFCNIEAMPLTDSLVKDIDVSIKRVSDQPRNPNNQANEEELAYILKSKEALKNETKVLPFLKEENGKMVSYYPIFTQSFCLQCHGDKSTDIQPEVLAKLNNLYPNDKATGYNESEIRGIWVVEMQKENQSVN